MCGICGIFQFNGQPVLRQKLEAMNKEMTHRGPDDEGYFIQGNFGMAMRRLSIIDIEGGHQPIFNEEKTIAVIMNGEIYNYLELRSELIRSGHRFSTSSDTEVIAHLFEEKGADCLSDLNGMFAFVVWDSKKKDLFVCRDRIGIKPFYFTLDSNSFIFSSDLSAIVTAFPEKKQICFRSFLSYLLMSYVPYPSTIFNDIYKLEPAHYMKISFDGKASKIKYWQINEFQTLKLPSFKDYQAQILDLLRDSIRLQMRSDVPIGTFLSGGLDSSCVVALLSQQLKEPIRTFSAGFKGGLNELPFAGLIAKKFKTNHSEIIICEDNILEFLPEVIDKMDEPFSDNAFIPTLILSKVAVSRGVKVILNGTGGDEIFGGYDRYLPASIIWRTINALPLFSRKIIGGIVKWIDFDKGVRIADPSLDFIYAISGVNLFLASKIFKDKNNYISMLNCMPSFYSTLMNNGRKNVKKHELMYLDLRDYLACDILPLLDKITMAVSLEGRVPLLDHRIVEWCFKLPDSIRFANKCHKGFFRTVLKDILPPEIMNLPKSGFAGPTNHWVNSALKESIKKDLIEHPIPFYNNILDSTFIKKALEFPVQSRCCSETLFALYIFNLWYKKHCAV